MGKRKQRGRPGQQVEEARRQGEALLGAAWGVVMWLFFSLTRDAGGRDLIYIAGTSAMIGGGVAAIFGTFTARKRGERLFPRLPYRRNRSR